LTGKIPSLVGGVLEGRKEGEVPPQRSKEGKERSGIMLKGRIVVALEGGKGQLHFSYGGRRIVEVRQGYEGQGGMGGRYEAGV